MAAISEGGEQGRVRRVIDGDSALLTDGTQVRYLGINTPEVGEPFSEEARALNRRLVEGKKIELMRDRERRDRYGRILAYVYANGQFVNAELLRAGLAHLLVFGPLREEPTLAAHQQQARDARRGMWGPGGPSGPLKITSPRSHSADRRPPRRLRTVTVCNISNGEVDSTGFSLEVNGRSFPFPRSRISPGHVALIVTRKGKDQLIGPGPRLFHWPEGRPSGLPGMVTLALRSPAGEVIDRSVLRLAAHPLQIFPRDCTEGRIAAEEKNETPGNG